MTKFDYKRARKRIFSVAFKEYKTLKYWYRVEKRMINYGKRYPDGFAMDFTHNPLSNIMWDDELRIEGIANRNDLEVYDEKLAPDFSTYYFRKKRTPS